MSWGLVGAGDTLRRKLIKINSQPEVLTDVEVWASWDGAAVSRPSQPADIRNLHYESISDQLYSTQLLERSYYKATRNSPIEGGQWENHKPAFAIDDKAECSTLIGPDPSRYFALIGGTWLCWCHNNTPQVK